MSAPSVLVIGASGRIGVQIVNALASQTPTPSVHAFVRTPTKLPSATADKCASVIQGNARSSTDVARALRESAADTAVIAIVAGNSTSRTDVRAATARALADCVKPGAEFARVRVVVVSSTGAGGTKIDLGFGVGVLLGFYLRHVMHDHDEQERAFKKRLEGNTHRLLIVRPTSLTEGHPTRKVLTFSGDQRAPSSRIDRADVAMWIAEQVCGEGKAFGKEVCVTGGK